MSDKDTNSSTAASAVQEAPRVVKSCANCARPSFCNLCKTSAKERWRARPRMDKIAATLWDLRTVYEAVGGELVEPFRKEIEEAVGSERMAVAVSADAMRSLLDYEVKASLGARVGEAADAIRLGLRLQYEANADRLPPPSYKPTGDPSPVIEAVRDFRVAIDQRVTRGAYVERMAKQEVLDALRRFEGKPTEAERTASEDVRLRASIRRAEQFGPRPPGRFGCPVCHVTLEASPEPVIPPLCACGEVMEYVY